MSKRKKTYARATFNPADIDPATGLTFAELERESRRRLAVYEANADPLPGPLALAFPAAPIRVGTLAIRPFVHADWATLRKLDSPLLKQIAEMRKPAEMRETTPCSDQEEWEMVLVFLLDPERAEALASNRAEFTRFAREKIGLGLNPFIFEMLKAAVIQQFTRCCETAVQFLAASASAPTDELFTKPPTAMTTASVGGSPTSAV